MAFVQMVIIVHLVKILHPPRSLFVNQGISVPMELCIPALLVHTKMNKDSHIAKFVHQAIIAMQLLFLLQRMETIFAHQDFIVQMEHSLILNILVRLVLSIP